MRIRYEKRQYDIITIHGVYKSHGIDFVQWRASGVKNGDQ